MNHSSFDFTAGSHKRFYRKFPPRCILKQFYCTVLISLWHMETPYIICDLFYSFITHPPFQIIIVLWCFTELCYTLKKSLFLVIPCVSQDFSSISRRLRIQSTTISNWWQCHHQLLLDWESRHNVTNTQKRVKVNKKAFSRAEQHTLELCLPSCEYHQT